MADDHRLMRYFQFDHLPPKLREVSEPFCMLARLCVNNAALRDGDPEREGHDPAELTAGLRHLLEAKDCVVRAML